MPIYQYECIKNRHGWESYYNSTDIRNRLDDPDNLICPVCGSTVRKLVSVSVTRMGKKSKWTGIDDVPSDVMTLGKVAVEGKIPAEFDRVIKSNKKKQKEFFKKDKEYKKREHMIKKVKEPIEIKS